MVILCIEQQLHILSIYLPILVLQCFKNNIYKNNDIFASTSMDDNILFIISAHCSFVACHFKCSNSLKATETFKSDNRI